MTKSPSITEYNLNLDELLQGTHQSSKTETVYQSFQGRPNFDIKGGNTASQKKLELLMNTSRGFNPNIFDTSKNKTQSIIGYSTSSNLPSHKDTSKSPVSHYRYHPKQQVAIGDLPPSAPKTKYLMSGIPIPEHKRTKRSPSPVPQSRAESKKTLNLKAVNKRTKI